MKVRRIRSGEEGAYDAFVLSREEDGSPFHLSVWRDLVTDFFGHRAEYLVATRDDRIVGVLPLFTVRSPFLGKALVSVPYGVYGGALAEDDLAHQALAEEGCRWADDQGVKYLEMRNLLPVDSALPRSDLYVTFRRDLPATRDECLSMIPRKSRASTRHARDRHGMEFAGGRQYLDDFYRLFVMNKRSLGSPVFGRSWFGAILDRFQDNALLHVVKHEGRIVAAVLSFVFGDTLMPYYSGSEWAAERLGSMNFMYWKLMELGVERGLRRFDFGRSRVGTGAASFKKNMGFEPTPLHYEYYLRDEAEIPSINPSNPRFDIVKNVWRRLPVPVVKLLGPRLMRYLP